MQFVTFKVILANRKQSSINEQILVKSDGFSNNLFIFNFYCVCVTFPLITQKIDIAFAICNTKKAYTNMIEKMKVT